MYTASLFDDLDEEFTLTFSPRQLIPEIPGLHYVADFVSRIEERELMEAANQEEWSTHWKRRTQYYGRRYGALLNDGRARDIPLWASAVMVRLVKDKAMDCLPTQMGANEYLPGQGIAPHVDHESGTVVSLSLGSGCVMDFRELETGNLNSMWLAPRSIVVMNGVARYGWTHGIAPRLRDVVDGRSIPRTKRISLTFRNVPAQ
jgi:alkylated DNA repair dioxygenase AlkB